MWQDLPMRQETITAPRPATAPEISHDVRAAHQGGKLAAAQAIAGLVDDRELNAESIIPSPLDARVVPTVAAAVAGVARREGAVAGGSRQ